MMSNLFFLNKGHLKGAENVYRPHFLNIKVKIMLLTSVTGIYAV